MPRRNLIPLLLLALLVVLTLVFAIIAILEEPTFAVSTHAGFAPSGLLALLGGS